METVTHHTMATSLAWSKIDNQIFSSPKAPAGTKLATKGLNNSKSQIFSSQKAPVGTTPEQMA